MSPSTDELPAIITHLGANGVLVWVIVNWLREIKKDLGEQARKAGEDLKELRAMIQKNAADHEHVIRGLSKALWIDLADRPTASQFVKDEARRMLQRAEEVERQQRSGG